MHLVLNFATEILRMTQLVSEIRALIINNLKFKLKKKNRAPIIIYYFLNDAQRRISYYLK